MPAACSACRCWEAFAVDCPLARASSSTVRGACASRSSSSRRRGLANALPITAIASKSASFSWREPMDCYSIDHLIVCQAMFFRQLLNDDTACASYLLGCKSKANLAVVDPHADLVDEYIVLAAAQGIPIVAVFETHVQEDHVSGLPELVARAGATADLPADAGVEFEHVALADGDVVELGNTEITAVATPGHAPAHHAYLVTDRVRGDEPWMVLTGDALLVGDAGRPDLHAHGEGSIEQMARTLYRSLHERLLALPDDLLLYPAHYSGSVCGRALSANPASTVGFERRHNDALRFGSEDEFVAALLQDIPPAPERQADIVAANRTGSQPARTE